MTCTVTGGTFDRLIEVNENAANFNDNNKPFITGGTCKNGQYVNSEGKTETFDNSPSKYVADDNGTSRIVKREGDALNNYVYTVNEKGQWTVDGVVQTRK